ncbi:MAG: DUF4340 domain-containing protein [Christensenellales bacterium]|jgi:hypothetical protein
MDRRKRNIIVACAVLVVLVAGYIALSLLDGEDQVPQDALIDVLTLTESDIVGIAYDFAGDDLSFTRVLGEGWHLREDRDFPLDETLPENMAHVASSIQASGKAEGASLTNPDFGFTDPISTVTLTLKDGSARTFTIGSKNAVTGEYYLNLDGSEDIYLVPAATAESFLYNLNALAAKPWPFQEGDTYSRVSVASEDLAIDFISYEEGWSDYYSREIYWFVDGVHEERVAGNMPNILTFLGNVVSLPLEKAVDYKPSEEELESYGLTRPVLSVNISYQRKSTLLTRLSAVIDIGDLDESGAFYHVRFRDQDVIWLSPRGDVERILNFKQESFVSPKVLAISSENVRGMDITARGREYRITAQGEGDDLSYAIGGRELTARAFKTFMTQLTNLTADIVTLEASGEEEPVFSISLTGAGGKSVYVAFIPYEDNFYIVRINGGEYLLISTEKVDAVIDALEAL